jgi:hypothetical protein
VTAVLTLCALAALPSVAHEQLTDGTTLVVITQPDAPEVSVRWAIRAGADDEPPSRAGLAHLVEHLVFRSPSADKLRGVIAAQQGHLNATTTAVATSFDLDLPRESFEKGFGALVQLVTTIDTSPLVIASEVGVVHHENELRRRSRGGTLERAVFGDPVVNGTETTLGRTSRTDVVAFLERFYRAGRTTLIVVGNVTLETVKQVVEAESRWPPAPVAELKPVPSAGGRVRVSISDFAYGDAVVAERFSLDDFDACRLHAAARHLAALRTLSLSRTTVSSDCYVVNGWAFSLLQAFSLDERAETVVDRLLTPPKGPTAPTPKDLAIIERRLRARAEAMASSPATLAAALVTLTPFLAPQELGAHAARLARVPLVTSTSLAEAKAKAQGEAIIILDGPFPDRLTRAEKDKAKPKAPAPASP